MTQRLSTVPGQSLKVRWGYVDVGVGVVRGFGESDAWEEPADVRLVALVRLAVVAAQIGLLYDPNLELDRQQEEKPTAKGDAVGNRKRDPGSGREHGGKNRVSDHCKRTACDELGTLVLIYTDTPVVAHVLLGDECAEDAQGREGRAGCLDRAVLKRRDGREPEETGDRCEDPQRRVQWRRAPRPTSRRFRVTR